MQQGIIHKESKEKIYSNTGNSDVLKLVPDGSIFILDIGCGDGANAKQLVPKGCIVDGITISETERLAASVVMRNVLVHNIEEGLPFKGKEVYDVVICSHVLEHICYPDNLIKDIVRLLKPGGVLIVALPNLFHYSSRWQLIKGNFNYADAGIWDYTHFRWYTFQTAKELLQKSGLVVEVATVTGSLPLNSVFSKVLPAGVSNFFYKMLIQISKGFFGYQLLYRAIKK